MDLPDTVKASQIVAELDPVDLDERLVAARFGVERAASAIRAADAVVAEAQSRAALANANVRRFATLAAQGFVSAEAVEARRHEANAAAAAVEAALAQQAAAQRDRARANAEAGAIAKLREQARLRAPVAGIVSARRVEPGTTVVAGQAVLQVIDPSTLWVRARIDQAQAGGVREAQAAQIVLRSEPRRVHAGRVARVEWLSDPITEERIISVAFDVPPALLPVGELAEVTIHVGESRAAPSIPTAAVKRMGRQMGVFTLDHERAAFRAVTLGLATLDGRSEVVDGVAPGEDVIVHSGRALAPDMRVRVVDAVRATRR
jgi:HlyD family secretion protein